MEAQHHLHRPLPAAIHLHALRQALGVGQAVAVQPLGYGALGLPQGRLLQGLQRGAPTLHGLQTSTLLIQLGALLVIGVTDLVDGRQLGLQPCLQVLGLEDVFFQLGLALGDLLIEFPMGQALLFLFEAQGTLFLLDVLLLQALDTGALHLGGTASTALEVSWRALASASCGCSSSRACSSSAILRRSAS